MGTTAADTVVEVPAGVDALIGHFPTIAFNDSDGLAHVSLDDPADVEIAAVIARSLASLWVYVSTGLWVRVPR